MDLRRPTPKQMPTLRARPGVVVLAVSVATGCYSGGSVTIAPPQHTAVAPSGTAELLSRATSAPVVAPAAISPALSSNRIEALPVGWQAQATARDWQYIVLHHTATSAGSVEGIDAVHRRRKDSQGRSWLGIGYHFVIGNGQGMPDGQVESTFRWRDQLHGAHSGVPRYNDWGIGVCLVGDFDQNPPTDKQLAAARELIAALRRRFDIAAGDVRRHGELVATDCPGVLFSVADVVHDAAARDTSTAAIAPVRSARTAVRQPFF
ncbi:MAG: peptidoglycan recognition family protein [Pirellulales bacterium]